MQPDLEPLRRVAGLGAGSAVDNDVVRSWFTAAGFAELSYDEHPDPAAGATVGVVRLEAPAQPLEPGQHLFSFVR